MSQSVGGAPAGGLGEDFIRLNESIDPYGYGTYGLMVLQDGSEPVCIPPRF